MLFPSFFNAQAGAYEIEQSLRFNGSDSAYLINSTPSTDGNRKTYTISVWVKKVVNSGTGGDTFFYATADASNIYAFTSLSFGNADAGHNESLRFLASDSGASQYKVRESTDAAYRDYSAWMHVVAVMDTTQATDANRAKIYVNGEQITDLTSTLTEPAQDYQNYVNGNNAKVQIGRNFNEVGQGPWYFDGYLAEYHLVDGQALDPTDFGEYDESGVWRPIRYTGTYGTNGFYLKFDPDATNGIGHDHSGNGNNFTASGFTTSGTGTDVMSDTPTTNYPTLNPIATPSSFSASYLSNGNLAQYVGPNVSNTPKGTFLLPSSGKWYWEVDVTAVGQFSHFGIGTPDGESYYYTYQNNGSSRTTGSTTASYGASYTTNDIIGVLYDADANSISFTKNGTSQGTAFTSISEDVLVPFFSGYYDAGFIVNFGQFAFEQTVPTGGYKPLNTANLPTPDIKDGSDYFDTLTYTGPISSTAASGTTGDVTGLASGFTPDLVWIKCRNQANWHQLFDQVRGVDANGAGALHTNSTNAETTTNLNGGLSAFNDGGFTVIAGSDTGGRSNNTGSSDRTYAAWCWRAGGSGSSIAAGSVDGTNPTIASTVSANPTAGFSIVGYTGTGNAETIAHGLVGVAPSMIIVKNRDLNQNWAVYHSALGATKALILDDTYSEQTATYYWNDTAPTNTVFSVGTWSGVSGNTQKQIAYCFAEVEGYSKFGSYTGNGSTTGDGPFVFLGFKPALVIWKQATGASDRHWVMRDSTRDPENPLQQTLYPSLSTLEQTLTAQDVDFLSNGFKIKTNWDYLNTNNETYIFAAFAEHPFGGDGVSPATAR